MDQDRVDLPTENNRRSWLAILLNPYVAIPVLVVCLLLSAPILFRAYKIAGVIDPGTPFDVEEFVSYTVPDAENAFVEYRRASSMLIPWLISSDKLDSDEVETAMERGWGDASEAVRQWVVENRPALDEWKLGTAKDKALYIDPRSVDFAEMLEVTQNLRAFGRLVKIETSRLEGEGHLDEAWEWHRAAFRCSRHTGQFGTMTERLVGIVMHTIAIDGISRWSGEPNLTSSQLKRAIEQLQADYELTALTSNMFKMDYVSQINSIKNYGAQELAEFMDLSPNLGAFGMWVFGEPDLYQMVLNLAMDNWLSQVDKPFAERAPLDSGTIGVYDRADAGPTISGRYVATPDEINHAVGKSLLARSLLSGVYRVDESVVRERARQRTLLLALAAQAYQRDHNEFPATANAVVAEYLDRIPTDPFGDGIETIQYRRDEQGCTVWSTGPNQLDDGGKINDAENGDIGFQFSRPKIDTETEAVP